MKRLPNRIDWLNATAEVVLIEHPNEECAYQEASRIIEQIDSIIYPKQPSISPEPELAAQRES